MRILRIALVPLFPGMFAFSYVWVVDGGGELFTCVPDLLAQFTQRVTGIDPLSFRRVLIPGYLLLFSVPIIAYAAKPKRGWLRVLGAFGLVHILVVGGLVLQDD